MWVSQPSSLQGTEGGSVTLPCSYNSTREPRLGSYTWVKEVAGARLELSNGTQEFGGRVSRAGDRSFLRERRADVELRDLRPYDNHSRNLLNFVKVILPNPNPVLGAQTAFVDSRPIVRHAIPFQL
uniref:Immunoglobulin V-set domain-containing protein n=1 Tax=Chelonoidis abingdonii TaxID=106734 RepID=A0A8C0GHT6_CHEAB